MNDQDEIQKWKQAFLDMIDGYWNWYDIKNATGETEERCKELIALGEEARKEQNQ